MAPHWSTGCHASLIAIINLCSILPILTFYKKRVQEWQKAEVTLPLQNWSELVICALASLLKADFGAGLIGRLRQWTKAKLGWDLVASITPKSERQKIKDSYHAENQQLTDLERRQADLEGNLGNDFGPHDVFLTLIDRYSEIVPDSCWACKSKCKCIVFLQLHCVPASEGLLSKLS